MRRTHSAYLYVLPMALIMVLLVYLPIIITFGYSLMNINLLRPAPLTLVGLRNYATILKDPAFRTAALNSLGITGVVLLLTFALGLVFALLLNKDSPIKGILTGVAIIPWAMPGVVNGIIWRWIFHPNFGLLNSILLKSGGIEKPIQWFSDRTMVLIIVGITVAWSAIPLAAVTLLSGLQSIPGQLYEAAEIDGCGIMGRFTHITLPLLRPAFGIVLTTTTISAINVLDQIVSLVGMSSANSSLMTEIYLRTFKYMRFSEGSALTYLVMIVCGIISVFYIRRVYTKVRYI